MNQMEGGDVTSTQSNEERTGRLQIILVAAVLVAGFAANVILSNTGSAPRQKAKGNAALLVEVIEPIIEDTRVSITETGVIRARNSIALSPQVSGRVIEVSPNLASGGSFEAGDTLFRIDPADYLAAVEQMRAEVARVEADLQVEMAEAQVAKDEWNLIHPGEPIPDLVARAPQISQRKAAVQSAKANLADAELQLTRVAFSLPFDGRITSTTIEIGQFLNFGQSYGNAYALGSIEISAPINADVMAALNPIVGRSAQVRQPSSSFRTSPSYRARIIRADAELDTDTRLAGVALVFEEPVPLLPGAFVEVEILGPIIPNAHLIPERAISENRQIWIVENGALRPRQARFFSSQDGKVVTMPFDYGDGIVTSPLIDPAEGMSVSIISAKDGAA
jgi:RND family efflux transporter MFP subunit